MRQIPTTLAADLRPSPLDRVLSVLTGTRDWLDARGRWAWTAAMITAFVAAWPLGLAVLGYIIWSKHMSCTDRRATLHGRCGSSRWGGPASTGNSAFDAYRAETLRRLEDEHQEFVAFLARLREAKDKAEFDQFMTERVPAQPKTE